MFVCRREVATVHVETSLDILNRATRWVPAIHQSEIQVSVLIVGLNQQTMWVGSTVGKPLIRAQRGGNRSGT